MVYASVWLALLCYPAGPARLAATAPAVRRAALLAWTVGCAAFLVHAVSSFAVFYDWSHATALRETARQVEELTGRPLGAGLYANYLFGLVWLADVVRCWAGARRPGRLAALALHGFMLFIIFNATVVFADGATRVLGVAVTAAGVAGLGRALPRLRAPR